MNKINITISREQQTGIANDWLKVGTMLFVSQVLASLLQGRSMLTRRWMMTSLFTLLGFTAYHLTTRKLFEQLNLSPKVMPIVEDWLKVGTMLVVSRMLTGLDMDRMWVMTSLFTLLGFTAFHLLTKNVINLDRFNLSSVQKNIANDWLKVGTMLVVSKLLSGTRLDEQWMRSSVLTLLGFTAYNLVTNRVVSVE